MGQPGGHGRRVLEWVLRAGRVVSVAAACCGLVGAATAAATATPLPAEPQLRIEAGMHTAMVNSIATDAMGRWAVTASDDKTVRVWNQASGRLLRVLRPPLGDGNEGKIYAVAISPDGNIVAAAGWARAGPESAQNVYLFNRQSGQMIRRMAGLPNVVHRLNFSPDGQWLAATLGGENGLRVWRWADGSAPLMDDDYGDSSYGATFMPAAKDDGTTLATASADGRLRLYRLSPTAGTPAGGRLKPVLMRVAPGGKEPRSLSFTPDGQLLAVGYDDSTRVDVLDAQTLTLKYTPSSAGVTYGDLGSVAFSADGRTLAAAGRWGNRERKFVRLWAQAGQGQPQDVPTVDNTVMDVVALPAAANGGWLVAAGSPAWGWLSPDGRWQGRAQPPTADLRGSRGETAFLLGDSGRVVQFGFGENGKSPHHFDLQRRRLQAGSLAGGQPPRITGASRVDSWINSVKPTLNGQPLQLQDYEKARSLALLPGDQGFVLGAEFRLRLYKPDGTDRWPPRPVPGVVWGVNVPQTGDLAGKVVVAAYADGTLRWHRISDGQELLAFFPHADRQRWVLWTPGGYYDAGPGGEDLIGWHLNRGADQAADFFPASRFRNRYYRPDVIDRVLETLDEAQALKQADAAINRRQEAQAASLAQALPPVLELLSGSEVRTSRPEVMLRVRTRTADDAPVTAWRVRINGELVPASQMGGPDRAEARPEPYTRQMKLAVPPADSEIRVFAENRHGVSTEAVVHVTWTGAKLTPDVVRPTLYVLAIGVGQYQHSQVNPLGDLPAKDARDFVDAVKRQQGTLYERVEVRLLTDAQATRDHVVDGLEWLQRKPRQFDVSMIFVSGHGVNDPTMGYLFLPVNADPDALKRTTVNWADFKSTVVAMAGKRVLFLDTCHSGNALGSTFKAPYTDITGVLADLAAAENGVVVFASSTGRQYSMQNPAWGNGAFTKAVVEGLTGKAGANARREVTHKRLSAYVSDRVRDLTQGRQSPVNPDPVGVPDFALAVIGP